MAKLNTRSFEFVRGKLLQLAGIRLTEAKYALVTGRLRERLAALRLRDFEEYVSLLESLPAEHHEWECFVNQLTTNKTEFFREPAHFKYLTDMLESGLLGGQDRPLRVWSAASSTGEEPYTLAMVLAEYARTHPGFTFSILASDIDTEVLEWARSGVYQRSRLGEVPEEFVASYFAVGTNGIERWVKVRESIRRLVQFEQRNLLDTSYTQGESFDVIFCRNVLIYFGSETIGKVAANLYAATNPGGHLILGHTESIQNIQTPWSYLKPSIYRKRA